MGLLRYLEEMNHLYLYTEKQLIDFSEIIPFKNKEWQVYSPVLYNILQFSCSQIESMIKKLITELKLKPKTKEFPSYYKILNQNHILEKQKLLLVSASKIIQPFKDKIPPSWWGAYNKSKHDLPNGMVFGTIENSVNALGGLYCLHNLAYLIRCNYDIMKEENWREAVYPKNSNPDPNFHNNYFPEITHNWKSSLFHHTRFFIDLERAHF